MIGCGLGELCRVLSGYGNFKGNTLAFICFSLGMTGSPLPIWLMRESFLSPIAEQGMPESYIATLETVSSPFMLVVLFAAPVVGAVIGAVVTKAMFKKHFEKAGIV